MFVRSTLEKVGMQFSATFFYLVTPSLCVRSNVNVIKRATRPRKTGKIMGLYILTIAFFGGRRMVPYLAASIACLYDSCQFEDCGLLGCKAVPVWWKSADV